MAAQEARKTASTLRTLLDSMADEVWACDAAGDMSLLSAQALPGIGLSLPAEEREPVAQTGAEGGDLPARWHAPAAGGGALAALAQRRDAAGRRRSFATCRRASEPLQAVHLGPDQGRRGADRRGGRRRARRHRPEAGAGGAGVPDQVRGREGSVAAGGAEGVRGARAAAARGRANGRTAGRRAAELQAVLDNMVDAVFVCDARGRAHARQRGRGRASSAWPSCRGGEAALAELPAPAHAPPERPPSPARASCRLPRAWRGRR